MCPNDISKNYPHTHIKTPGCCTTDYCSKGSVSVYTGKHICLTGRARTHEDFKQTHAHAHPRTTIHSHTHSHRQHTCKHTTYKNIHTAHTHAHTLTQLNARIHIHTTHTQAHHTINTHSNAIHTLLTHIRKLSHIHAERQNRRRAAHAEKVKSWKVSLSYTHTLFFLLLYEGEKVQVGK